MHRHRLQVTLIYKKILNTLTVTNGNQNFLHTSLAGRSWTHWRVIEQILFITKRVFMRVSQGNYRNLFTYRLKFLLR